MNIYLGLGFDSFVPVRIRPSLQSQMLPLFAREPSRNMSKPSVLLPRELNVAQLTAKLQIADEETRAGRGRRLM